MAKQLDSLTEKLTDFINEQHIFFVGTAASDGRVNVSPKGMDTLRVTGPNELIWLNLTGSGNETAAHILQNNRMTIMFCAFEGKPLILRLYGQSEILHPRNDAFKELIKNFGDTEGARQIFRMKIDLVQTSCGFAVPLMDFQQDRSILKDWAKNKGESGIKEYWKEKNQSSLDGYKTNILIDHSSN
ncbi:pyridoxamine 5'-phosphate oxidase family protein [Portibacter marinus]|uniref:pyridoxamine 5'-phosphate oxidase family protein n=1 Tax=Portibacter marinus TaxID=2898660 RepID=UPI001F165561|nr:pyridoxamine 5'-phosphate oxidase family protein [Portibacter marinus]